MQRAEIIFVVLLFPLAAGIYTITFFKDPFLPGIFCVFLLLTLALSTHHIFHKKVFSSFHKILIGALVYVQVYLLGALLAGLNKQALFSSHFSYYESNYLKIRIDTEPQQKANIIRFTAKVIQGFNHREVQIVTGRLLLATKIEVNPLIFAYGDEFIIPAQFTAVEPPYNPGEFDVENWLENQNVYQQGFLKTKQFIKIDSNRGNPIIAYALSLRKRQVNLYRQLIVNDEAFAVASTLILGYRSDLSADTLQAYSATGTIHALSVSGMHVGIIYIILNRMFSFLDRWKAAKVVKVLLIISLIWYYSLITGFCPAVLRSAIMLSVFILAKSFTRNSNSYNIMGFAAFFLLIWSPLLLYDVGFQLSFISVFGLIYLQPKIYQLYAPANKWMDKIWSPVALSLAAQIITFPLSIYYFHQFPIYFLLGNLFILIPITVLMYLGLIILLFKATFLAPAFEWIISFTNKGLAYIANLPFSTLSNIWISKTALVVLSFAIVALIYALSRRHKPMLYLSLASLLFFQGVLSYDKMQASRQHKVMFFSLKKNFATAFLNADTAYLLTDLTQTDKTFVFSIKPFLDQHRIATTRLVRYDEQINTAVLYMDSSQIRFHHLKILKYDPLLQKKTVLERPRFDILWFHNSPQFKMEAQIKAIDFQVIVADATNNPSALKYYKNSTDIFHLDYHLLKKNPSYLIDLNK
jgi:competence protein ComEC